MTTETDTITEAREFQVPVVVTVCVTVAPDGTPTITAAYPDLDGAPWAYSGDPAAYEPETDEGGSWHEGRGDEDEPYIVAWNAAIDGITADVEGRDAATLDRLANLFRLPEWQFQGSGATFLDVAAGIIQDARDLETGTAPPELFVHAGQEHLLPDAT